MRDLVEDARNALAVEVVRTLVPGGQKQVHVVVDSRGTESILKLIDLGRASDPAALERARREVPAAWSTTTDRRYILVTNRSVTPRYSLNRTTVQSSR